MSTSFLNHNQINVHYSLNWEKRYPALPDRILESSRLSLLKQCVVFQKQPCLGEEEDWEDLVRLVKAASPLITRMLKLLQRTAAQQHWDTAWEIWKSSIYPMLQRFLSHLQRTIETPGFKNNYSIHSCLTSHPEIGRNSNNISKYFTLSSSKETCITFISIFSKHALLQMSRLTVLLKLLC